MYKIVPDQLDWTRLVNWIIPTPLEWIWLDSAFPIVWTSLVGWVWVVPEDGLYLNPYFAFRRSAIEVFLEYSSRLPLPGFSLANATRPPSPTMSHPSSLHILKPIGVVPARCTGLFLNSTFFRFPNNNTNKIILALSSNKSFCNISTW